MLTQTPVATKIAAAGNLLDRRYPAGSRVVLVVPPYRTNDARVLSQGLAAAGDPVLGPDGHEVYFPGKARPQGTWQIYVVSLTGGRPRALTQVAGGAMNPAIIAHGDLVFCSPVPIAGRTGKVPPRTGIYAQGAEGRPRRLTFGAADAREATVLKDGRILFVSATFTTNASPTPKTVLFTINNDGTEVTAFAGQHDRQPGMHRPRELGDGRVAFLTSLDGAPGNDGVAESVSRARPFMSRQALFGFMTSRCRSVEPGGGDSVLACLDTTGLMGRAMKGSFAVYQIRPGATAAGQPLFDDPAWNDLEATRVMPRPRPMGHLSAMIPTNKTGTILCLDANRSTEALSAGTGPKAVRVRVIGETAPGQVRSLGLSDIQPDGSFMVEVPVDVPLGFETLDERNQVVRQSPPALWVRAGENRSCIGCHEPHNHSPRNARPRAANFPPAALCPEPGASVASSNTRP